MNIALEDIKQLDNLELLAKQLVEGFITGLHKSPYHGFSVEFAEHKLYNYGDSTRNVDWKVYARTDRLYTKQYEEETNLRAHLLLDTSGSMHYPDGKGKLKYGILSAAALSYLLTKQRDAVGLTTFGASIHHQSAVKTTPSHLRQIWAHLSSLMDEKPTNGTDVPMVLHEIADKIHKRSLVVLMSDMFDQSGDIEPIFDALQHLKHNKHEILIFHITDRSTELDFEFEDRPHDFIDLETGDRIRVNPSEVKDHYQRQSKSRYEALKMRCGAHKIDFVEVDIAEPFDKVLGAYLIKRKRMR